MKHIIPFLFVVMALSIGLSKPADAKSMVNPTLNSSIVESNDGFMALYVQYLKNDPELSNPENYSRYALVYIDNDDIPELVLEGTCEANGFCVLTQHQGVVTNMVTARLGLSYIEKSGLCCNSNGHMGYYFSYVFQLKDGEFTEIARWESAEDPFGSEDDVTFSFNGVEMEESRADALLDEAYASKGTPIDVYDCQWQDLELLLDKK